MSGGNGNAVPLKTNAQLDLESLERFNKILTANVKRHEKMMQHFEWRGAKYPPFSIEPMAHERQRLDGKGMTATDRVLRKQWLQDQVLAPEEPLYIKELYKQNPIRRVISAPWNAVFKTLQPVMGAKYAAYGRWVVPKLALIYGGILLAWYQIKYSPNRWTGTNGAHMYWNRPTILPGDRDWPCMQAKENNDFYNKGFKERTVLLDVSKTSLPDHQSYYAA